MTTSRTPCRSTTIESRLPLINPETLFSVGVWRDVLQFVFEYGQNVLGKTMTAVSYPMRATFYDLYFSKIYKNFNWKLARERLSAVGDCSFTRTSNEEPQLKVSGLGFVLYGYKGSTVVSMNGAVASDFNKKKAGHALVDWSMPAGHFLEVVDALEDVLTGKGELFQCRAKFEMNLGFVQVKTRAFYGCHSLWPDINPNDPEKGPERWRLVPRSVAPPQFLIKFK